MTEELHWPREMAPVDYLMFRGEAEPRSRSSMLSVGLLDQVPDFDRLKEAFDRASRVVLRLRQRVVVPALPIGPPQWVVDPDFDLDFHVRRVRAPAPGSMRGVLGIAQTIMASPLDTARPLWEVTLLEDVDADGARAALIMKLNHAVTDGVGGIELFKQLYDFERDASRGVMPPLPVPSDVSSTDLVRDAIRRAPIKAVGTAWKGIGRALGIGSRTARNPGGAIGAVRSMGGSIQRVIGPPPVQPSPLLRRRGLGRRFECHEVPLDDLRRAAKAGGGSVNDAYTAAIGGALRRYHEALGVPVDAVPLAMPVNLRTDDDPAGGNRFAGARLSLPVAETNPAVRMLRVREQVVTAVAEPAINVINSVAPVLSRLPAPMLGAFAAMAASTDIQASNVSGYPEAPYIAGAKIVKQFPFGPVPGVAMMIVMVSQAGTCFIGVNYDTASITDPGLFRRSLQEGFDEVLALGAEPSPRSHAKAVSS